MNIFPSFRITESLACTFFQFAPLCFPPAFPGDNVRPDVDDLRLAEPSLDVPSGVVADRPPRREPALGTLVRLVNQTPLHTIFWSFLVAILEVDILAAVARHVLVVAIEPHEAIFPVSHPARDSSVVALPKDKLVGVALVHVLHHRLHELHGETVVTILTHVEPHDTRKQKAKELYLEMVFVNGSCFRKSSVSGIKKTFGKHIKNQ